jgi:hypothetical protein
MFHRVAPELLQQLNGRLDRECQVEAARQEALGGGSDETMSVRSLVYFPPVLLAQSEARKFTRRIDSLVASLLQGLQSEVVNVRSVEAASLFVVHCVQAATGQSQVAAGGASRTTSTESILSSAIKLLSGMVQIGRQSVSASGICTFLALELCVMIGNLRLPPAQQSEMFQTYRNIFHCTAETIGGNQTLRWLAQHSAGRSGYGFLQSTNFAQLEAIVPPELAEFLLVYAKSMKMVSDEWMPRV